MKKLIFTASIVVAAMLTTKAQQNLVFDNTFNNGNPVLDGFTSLPPNYVADYGRMKRLNDSIFVYYINTLSSANTTYESLVRAVISHTDGTATYENVHSFSGNYGGGGQEDWLITDIITNPSNGHIYIVRNALYDDLGTTRRCVQVHARQYNAVNGIFDLIPNWGQNASGATEITQSGTGVWGAKGTIMAGVPYLAMNADAFNARNVVLSGVVSNGQGFSASYVTSNANSEYSQVADIIAISPSEVYIADNAYKRIGSAFPYTYNDLNRILKWNVSQLDQTYGSNNGIAYISWNSQNNTAFPQDYINRMVYDGGKLLVAGHTREDQSSSTAIVRGRITRFTANGTADTTFQSNGTFEQDFSAERFNWRFADIDLTSDGNYFVSGTGNATTSNNSPNESYIIRLDNTGAIQNNVGNNGFLFETTDYSEIIETIILPGTSALVDKFVFNGMKVINPDPQLYQAETAVGRLVWSNGTSSVNDKTQSTLLNIYPNPTNSTLNIQAKENTNIHIMNMLGEKVADQELYTGTNCIDISGFAIGIYLIQMEKGEVVKFIKE